MDEPKETLMLRTSNITFQALGDFEAQKRFVSTYLDAIGASNRLDALLKPIFRRLRVETDADRVLFTSALLIEEDADEIVLLLANGRSTGALKILRGMFERAVTMHHVSREPADADFFINYRHIRREKLLRKIVEEFGVENLAETDEKKKELQDSLEDAKHEADRVRPNFMVPACKVCGTERLNQTWSKADVVTMAAEGKKDKAPDGKPSPSDFRFAVFHAWLTAIEETHATVEAFERRMYKRADGIVDYTFGPFPDLDRLTLDDRHTKMPEIQITLGGVADEFARRSRNSRTAAGN